MPTCTECDRQAGIIDDLVRGLAIARGRTEAAIRVQYGIEAEVVCFRCGGPYSPFCCGEAA